jgi:hypothetical protein
MACAKSGNYNRASEIKSPAIFRLPVELRLNIYDLVLGAYGFLQRPYNTHEQKRNTLSLLLVNRQVYDEARVLPFRNQVFDFDKPSASGMDDCGRLLRRLCNWQMQEIQHIKLAVLERDLTADVNESIWIFLCTSFSDEEVGLKHLKLSINGYLHDNGINVLDANADWVVNGLLRLEALQTLEVDIAFSHVPHRLVDGFHENLHHLLPGVNVLVRDTRRFFCTIL